jgi:hypothetical protein
VIVLLELAAVGLGLVLALAFGTTRRRLWALLGLGLILAIGVFFLAYLNASPDDPASCSDCGYYWGRWWQPYFTAFMLGFYFILWCVLVLVGYVVRGRFVERHADVHTPPS